MRPDRNWRRDEAGVTLVEMLVVIVIMGIVGGIVTTSFIGIERVNREHRERLDDLGDARVAITEVSRQVRASIRLNSTAPLLTVASPTSLEFLANQPDVADGPIKLRYDILGGVLTETRWLPDAGSAPDYTYTGTPITRTLAADLTAASAFSYLDLGLCPSDPSLCTPLDAEADPATGLTFADRNTVDTVRFDISVQGSTDPAIGATTFETAVLLRNSPYVPKN